MNEFTERCCPGVGSDVIHGRRDGRYNLAEVGPRVRLDWNGRLWPPERFIYSSPGGQFDSFSLQNKKSMRQLKGQDECFSDFAKHVESGEKNSLERVERYLEASKVSIIATDILMKQGRGSAELH